jgi:hypothetical protein
MRGLPSPLLKRFPRRLRPLLVIGLLLATLPLGPAVLNAFYRPALPSGTPAVGSTKTSGLQNTPPVRACGPIRLISATKSYAASTAALGFTVPSRA